MKKRPLLYFLLAVAALAVCKQHQTNAEAPQQVSLKIQATTSVVLPGQKTLLSALVSGSTDQSVEWSLKEGEAAGSITLSSDYSDTAHGGPLWVYTASNTPGTYHVVATAIADPRHSVTMALVVQPFVSGCTTRPDEVGLWQNITPRQVDLTRGDFFGMQAMVIDPIDPSTIYVGRALDGIYKSIDCGANWKKISTGRNSQAMASGRSWTMVIDPSNPQIIYTNQSYGVGGVFKTTNGGLDWQQVLTPNVSSVVPYDGFIGSISMDPNDPRHLLVGWHAECPPPYSKACFAETVDGGTSWKLRDGDPSWTGGEGTSFQILDSKSWIFTSQSNGLWVSRDNGASWQRIAGVSISHGVGQLYRAKDGSFYLGAGNGIVHSVDGVTWDRFPKSEALIMGLIGDGRTLYFSKAFPYNPPGTDPYLPYYSSPERSTFEPTPINSPMMRNGAAELHLDTTRHILYSTNLNAGLWRLVTQ